jgi:protocatechuate 3,4-dioxygenase beta subunit
MHQTLVARAAASQTGGDKAPAQKNNASDIRPVSDSSSEDKGDVIVMKGRVLGPDGKPVAGAKVRFVNAEVETDKDGSYRVSYSRPEGDKGEFTRASRYWYAVAATAPGYGPDFREIGRANKDGNLDLYLVKDDIPIEGKLLDLEGRPVAGATVRIARLSATPEENLDVFLKAWKFGPLEALSGGTHAPQMLGDPAKRKEIARPQWRNWWGYWEWQPIKPVTTDKEGKFKLTGVGRERFVELAISGPTLQDTHVRVVTRKGIDVKDLSTPDPDYLKQEGLNIRPVMGPFPTLYGPSFEHIVGPTKPVVGVVRDKATGKPLAGVRIIGRIASRDITMISDIETVTDEKGRYKLTGFAKSDRYVLGVVAKERTPYLPQGHELNDTEGLKPLQASFDLLQGIKVRGKLIDKATGKPAPGTVHYALLPGNPQYIDVGTPYSLVARYVQQQQSVDDSGQFELNVFPGEGVIFAEAKDNRFLPIFVRPEDEKKGVSAGGIGGGCPALVRGHAYGLIDPADGAEPLKLDLEFATGRTLTGAVAGPDGKPLPGARGMVTALQNAITYQPHMPSLSFKENSAEFTLENVDPRRPFLLIFQQPDKKMAGVLKVQGDEKEKLTAKLHPGGKLTGRVLDTKGQALADATVDVALGKQDGQYLYPTSMIARATTDQEGRFTIEGVLPDINLMLLVGVADKLNRLGRTIHSVDDLNLKSEQLKDLGDLKTQYK